MNTTTCWNEIFVNVNSRLKSSNDLCVLNVADPGEEIDDEVNSLLLSHLGLNVITLLVNGKMSSEKRLARCKKLGIGIDQVDHHHMVAIEDWRDTILASAENKFNCIVVQQNAPIRCDDSHHAVAIANWLNHLATEGVDIVYIAQGTFGKCVNTGGDALEGALLLQSAARVGLCTDSTSNMAFTYNFYKSPHLPETMKKAIATLFLQNTMGRAPAHGYCRHLVGKGGANFETSHNLWDALWDALKPTLTEHLQQYPWEKLHLHPNFPRAMATAKKYCDPSNPANFPDAETFARMKLGDIGQTREDQIHGLARMMTAFNLLFGTSVDEIMYSSDPAWEIAADGGKFHPIFEKVMTAMAQNPHTEWTPAYDVTSGLLVIAFIHDNCQIVQNGAVSKWFEVVGDDEVAHCVYKPGMLSLGTLFDHLGGMNTVHY